MRFGWQEAAVVIIVSLAVIYVIRVLLRSSGVIARRTPERPKDAPDVPVSRLLRKRDEGSSGD